MQSATIPTQPPDQQPHYARRNEKGFYRWEGIDLPSVTTVLQAAAGGHLLNWYAKMAASECARIAQLIRDDKIDLDEGLDKILDWGQTMKAAERYRDERGRIGSLTHHALYHHSIGSRWPTRDELVNWLTYQAASLQLLPPSEDESMYAERLEHLVHQGLPYVMAALTWIEEAKPEWEMIGLEAAVFSLTHGYAGTMDGIARIKGKRLVLDFKTSNRLGDSFRYQVEAYRRADFIGLVADGSTHEIGETDGTAIVHIRPEGAELVLLDGGERSDEVWQGWLGLLQYYRSTVALPPIPRPSKPPLVSSTRKAKECPF